MERLIVALVVMQASTLLGVVGYIYNDAKKRDQRRKGDIEKLSKDIQNLGQRMADLEANLYGHEEGSEGYISMTQEEIDDIHEKLDCIQQQMNREHVETKNLLGEVVNWIEKQDGEDLDIDYNRKFDFEDD